MWLKDKLTRYGKNKRWDSANTILIFLVVFLTQASTNGATKNKKITCSQIGTPESNVTLMKGFHNPSVEHLLIGHVRTLNECVEIACRRENVSLAYTSRFDCYAIRCNGDEEACWLLPSFKNPSLVFARLHRGISSTQRDISKKDQPLQSKKNSRRNDIHIKTENLHNKRKKRENDDSLVDFLTGKTVYEKTESTGGSTRTKRYSELRYDWKRRRKIGSRFRRYLIKNDRDSENEVPRPVHRSSALEDDNNSKTKQLENPNKSENAGNKILERVKRDVEDDDEEENGHFKDTSFVKETEGEGSHKALGRFKREDLEEDSEAEDEPEVQRFKRKADDYDEEDEDSSGFLSRILETHDTDLNSNDILDSGKADEQKDEHSDSLHRYKRKALRLEEMDELGKVLSTDFTSTSAKDGAKEKRSFPQSQSSTSSVVISGPSSSTSSQTSSSTQSSTNPSSSQTSSSQISSTTIRIPKSEDKQTSSLNESQTHQASEDKHSDSDEKRTTFPQSQSSTSNQIVIISGPSSSTSSQTSSSTQSSSNPSSSQTSTSQISSIMIRIPKSKDKQYSQSQEMDELGKALSTDFSSNTRKDDDKEKRSLSQSQFSTSPSLSNKTHELEVPVDSQDGHAEEEKRSFPQSQSSSSTSSTSSSTQSSSNPSSSSQTSISQSTSIIVRIPKSKVKQSTSPSNKSHELKGPVDNQDGHVEEEKRSFPQSQSSSSTSSTSSSTQSSSNQASSSQTSISQSSSIMIRIPKSKDKQSTSPSNKSHELDGPVDNQNVHVEEEKRSFPQSQSSSSTSSTSSSTQSSTGSSSSQTSSSQTIIIISKSKDETIAPSSHDGKPNGETITKTDATSNGPQKSSSATANVEVTIPIPLPNPLPPPQTSTSTSPNSKKESDVKTAVVIPQQQSMSSTAPKTASFSSAVSLSTSKTKLKSAIKRSSSPFPKEPSSKGTTSTLLKPRPALPPAQPPPPPHTTSSSSVSKSSFKAKILDTNKNLSEDASTQLSKSKENPPETQKKTFSAAPQSTTATATATVVIKAPPPPPPPPPSSTSTASSTSTSNAIVSGKSKDESKKSSEKDKQLKRKGKTSEGKKSSAIPQQTSTSTATATATVVFQSPPPPPPPPPPVSSSSATSTAKVIIIADKNKKTTSKTRKHTKTGKKGKVKEKTKNMSSSKTLNVPVKKVDIKRSSPTRRELRLKRNSEKRNKTQNNNEDSKKIKRQAIYSVFPHNTAHAYPMRPRFYNYQNYPQPFIPQQKSQVIRPNFVGYPSFQNTQPRAQKFYTTNNLKVPAVANYPPKNGPPQQRSRVQPWTWREPNTMPYHTGFHPSVQDYGGSNSYGSRASIPSLAETQSKQASSTTEKINVKDESCNFPLGMQSGQIKQEQLTSSSDFSKYHTATRGRLNFRPDQTGQAGAWCAAKDHIDRFQYLQIDLGKRQKICRVATQGMAEFPIWVTEYTLEFGNNGHIWADYTENGREKTFIGNADSTTPVSHSLRQPITARYVRFKPKSWNGASICMRAEVYTSQDPALTTSDEKKLVAYLNFDKHDDTEVNKRMKVAEKAGTCGDAGNFHNGKTVVLDVSKIQPKPRDAITIAAWIRLDDIKGQHSIFDTIGGHSTHNDGQYHFEVSDGKLRWYHRNETAHRIFSVESDAVVSPKTWTHVAGTYDAHTGTSKVFIDGHMNGESQGSGLLSQDWESHAGIGKHKDYRFLDGEVDEFRIYNFAMDQDGIRKLMKTCDYKDPKVCGGTLSSSKGSVSTPNWPIGYKGAKSCTWTVNVGQRDTIALNFESFALQEDGNCDKSKFIVKDGDNEDGDELGEFCGLNSPKVMQSKTNKLWLHFVSTDQGEGKGFRLTYETNKNPQSKKEVRPHAGKTLKCSASTVESNVTLVGGIKAGSFSEALGVDNLDMCMRQCCLKDACDLAFMISKSCYLVDCLNDDLCKTKKARPSNMSPTIVYINHLKESPLDLHTGLADEPPTSLAPPTPQAPSCHHTDVAYNVTLVGGIKAGKFNTFGHMNSIDDCIRHCCHDDKCDVAFMIQNNCYNVECENRMACQMKKAKPSPYNPTVAYVYRGDAKPLAEPVKKIDKPAATSCSSVSITPTLYNVTLVGGVKSGKFTDKGVVNSMDECKAYCCADDTCNVAFLIRTNCFLVACKDYELCKVKQAMSDYYHPKLAYVNWNPPDDEVKSDVRFASLGCWRDTAAYAIPSLEGSDSVLMGSYMTRVKPIDTCANVAYKRGYKVFAIQNGGACLSGAKADETFNKYGESADCKMGKGGVGANDVYRMNYDGSYNKVGCWRDTESRAMTDLENKDSRLNDPYQTRASPLVKCADVARQQGYPVFGIQDGGRCMSGPAAEDSYKQFGISRDCRGILGGSYANSVYKLIGKFDLQDQGANNNTQVHEPGSNKGSLSKPNNLVVSEDPALPGKTSSTSQIEDFVTMKNGQPERIVYTAGKIHFNETLKYGIKSGKFMDKGRVQNVTQCISLCGRQPDCDLAFMLGTQCYAVSCESNVLCATKPAYSAFYNPAIVFVTNRKVFSVVQSKKKKCHVSEIRKEVTLVGGINAGKFENLGQTSDMSNCIKRCCAKKTCDVAFLLEEECYGVSCLSNELCKTRPAKNPWRYRPQIAYTYHDADDVETTPNLDAVYASQLYDKHAVQNQRQLHDKHIQTQIQHEQLLKTAFATLNRTNSTDKNDNKVTNNIYTKISKNTDSKSSHKSESKENDKSNSSIYGGLRDYSQLNASTLLSMIKTLKDAMEKGSSNPDKTQSLFDTGASQTVTMNNVAKQTSVQSDKSHTNQIQKPSTGTTLLNGNSSLTTGNITRIDNSNIAIKINSSQPTQSVEANSHESQNKTQNEIKETSLELHQTAPIKNASVEKFANNKKIPPKPDQQQKSSNLSNSSFDKMPNKSQTKNMSSNTNQQHKPNIITTEINNSIGNKSVKIQSSITSLAENPMPNSDLTRTDPQRPEERGMFVNLGKNGNNQITYLQEKPEKPTYVHSKKTRITELGVLTQIKAADNARRRMYQHVSGNVLNRPYVKTPYVKRPNEGFSFLKQHNVASTEERQHDLNEGYIYVNRPYVSGPYVKRPYVNNVEKSGLVVLGPNSGKASMQPNKIASIGSWKGWKMSDNTDLGGLRKIHLQNEQSAVQEQHKNAHAYRQGQTITNHDSTLNSKPNISPKYFPAIGQTSTHGNAENVCWDGDVAYNKTLIGGINSGVFKDNGKATTMDMCMQFCCKRDDCDLAFMIEDDCYSVACSSPSSCKMRTARPTQFFPRISYTKKFRELMTKEKSSLSVATSATTPSTQATQINSSPTPTQTSSGSMVPSTTAGPTVPPTVHVQHSCVATPTKYNVTLKMGLHSGLFTKMGRVDSMDDCIELNCKQSKADVAFMMGTHCFSVQCYSADLCKTEPVFATSFSRLNLKPAVSFLKKNPGSNGPSLALQDNPRETCLESPITYNVTLRGGIGSGNFVERPHAKTMRKCISECCDSSCDLAFMFGDRCYSVTCDSEKACQAVLAKPTNLYPRIAYMNRNTPTSSANEGLSLAASEDTAHPPQCHNDFTKNIIARNKTLVGGLEAGTFKFLGKVKTMDICMRKCCSRPNCDVAYLIDKNCFSVRCFSHDLCKISTAPSVTNGDVEISAMRRTVKKEELPEDSHSVVVYIIVGALMFAAGLGGIVWAVCMFLRRHRLRQRHRSRRPSEG